MNKNKLKIWCTYHNQNILKDYDLHDTNNINLFNDDDRTLINDNINYLHDYLGEMTTYYYVWKNQIKSEYIGFCQYRRYFNYINFNDLITNGVTSYSNIINVNTLYDASNYIINDFIFFEFINYMYYKYGLDIYDNIFLNKNQKISYHSMNIYKWDIFNEVCDFMFGFLDYLTLGKWKDEKYIIHLSQFYHLKDINYKNENIFKTDWYWKRAWSVINEYLLGIYINIKYNININNSNNKYFISLDENVNISDINQFIIDLSKWYKLNVKTGIIHFYVEENIYNILTEHNFDFYEHNYLYQYVPQNLIEIKLKLNERIQCEDSIEFHKGNYKIINI